MTNSQAQVGDTTIEIDTSELEKKLTENMKADLKPYFEQYLTKLKKENWKENSESKGVSEAYMPEDTKAKLVEEFQKGKQFIREQWTVALPHGRTAELSAHMRDFIYVTEVLKGNQGDTVNYISQTWS